MRHLVLTALLLSSISFKALASQDEASALKGLITHLEKFGFKVIYKHPPIQSAYGLFVSKTKTIFISPLAFELGIGKQVLLHEAAHAAQSCPSGTLSPIGWQIKTSDLVRNEISGILFNSYKHASKSLEEEAFLVQAHHNGVSLIKTALAQRCAKTRKSRR